MSDGEDWGYLQSTGDVMRHRKGAQWAGARSRSCCFPTENPSPPQLDHPLQYLETRDVRGPPLENWRGPGVFLKIDNFVGKMGKINKWPESLVEIQPIPR